MFNHTEKEIEDFIEKHSENLALELKHALEYTAVCGDWKDICMRYIGRQLEVGTRRLDMLFKASNVVVNDTVDPPEFVEIEDVLIVVELKKNIADINAFSQVVGYAADIKEIGCIDTFICLVAPSFSSEIKTLERYMDNLILIEVEKKFDVKRISYSLNDDYIDSIENSGVFGVI